MDAQGSKVEYGESGDEGDRVGVEHGSGSGGFGGEVIINTGGEVINESICM